MLIWDLQSSQCSKIRVAQHWERRRVHLIENKGVKSECMKFGENSRQMPSVSTICDEYCSFRPVCLEKWSLRLAVENTVKRTRGITKRWDRRKGEIIIHSDFFYLHNMYISVIKTVHVAVVTDPTVRSRKFMLLCFGFPLKV